MLKKNLCSYISATKKLLKHFQSKFLLKDRNEYENYMRFGRILYTPPSNQNLINL